MGVGVVVGGATSSELNAVKELFEQLDRIFSQEESGFAVGLAMLEKHGDKGALPGLQLLPATVDRTFGEGCSGQCVRRHLLEAYLDAIRDALDFLDDSIGKGKRLLPERRKLLLHPRDALG